MDLFRRQQLMGWLIGILVVLNIGTLSFIWFQHSRRLDFAHPPRKQPEDVLCFLKQELQLNEEQERRFVDLRQRHFTEMQRLNSEIHQLKHGIMEEVFRDEPDEARVKMLVTEIGQRQAQIEDIIFRHFRDMRAVCKHEQCARFQNLILEAGPRDYRHSRFNHPMPSDSCPRPKERIHHQ
jgi:hypothetical protein